MSKMLCNVSLRIWHPTFSAADISSEIGLEAVICHDVGMLRTTPAGTILSGTYKETYVVMPLVKKKLIELDEEIESWCDFLASRKLYLSNVVSSGGRGDIYVSIFVPDIGGFMLGGLIMEKIIRLNLDLSVEIYAG